MAKQITINYPDNLPDAMHLTQEEFEKEASKAMAFKLFEMKRISSGTAANLLGMDRVQFIFMLKEPFDYTLWQKDLLVNKDVKDIANKAMEYRKHNK